MAASGSAQPKGSHSPGLAHTMYLELSNSEGGGGGEEEGGGMRRGGEGELHIRRKKMKKERDNEE